MTTRCKAGREDFQVDVYQVADRDVYKVAGRNDHHIVNRRLSSINVQVHSQRQRRDDNHADYQADSPRQRVIE